jgi:hypothetical protein
MAFVPPLYSTVCGFGAVLRGPPANQNASAPGWNGMMA